MAAELRGLIYVASPVTTEAWTAETVRAALRLVPLAERLPELPPRGHDLSRFYRTRFARAFAGASLALQALGPPEAAARADQAAEAIRLGRPAEERRRALEAFALAARRAGY